MRRTFLLILCVLFAVPAVRAEEAPAGPSTIDFSRQIRPLLSNTCFNCHGPDEGTRQAGLRLDLHDGALAELDSGAKAIVPGNVEASELIARITSTDPDVVMPPPDANRQLTDADKKLLQEWVASGAGWDTHWSFAPPKRPVVPQPAHAAQAKNDIDRFVFARLEREGLTPSAEADKETLIRRVTLDLTGLPPTLAEIDAFLADTRPDAYELLVDRLLASPHYGERMAVNWLDAARYADTHGYHIDSHRDMWRWREWVINAFNTNKPFDQFTVEQLAGDLLPDATLEQKIASGFNRNHMINFEGGAIPEEYLTNYILDRVNTTSTVWMGLTVGCAQCHDHKYDPISQKDYYQLYAFFNNVPESGLDGQKGNAAPMMPAPTASQQQQQTAYQAQIADLEAKQVARRTEQEAAFVAWAQGPHEAPTPPPGIVAHYALDETEGTTATDASAQQPPGQYQGRAAWVDGKHGKAADFDGASHIAVSTPPRLDRDTPFSYGAWINPRNTGHMAVMSCMNDGAAFQGWDLYLGDGKIFVHLIHRWQDNALRVNTKQAFEPNVWRHVFVTYDGTSKAAGVKLYVDGQPVELEVTHDTLTETIAASQPLHIGRRNPGAPFNGLIDDVRIYNRALAGEEVARVAGADPIAQFLAIPVAQRTPEQVEQLRNHYFQTHDATSRELAGSLAAVRKQLTDLEAAIPSTMVMQELPQPRETFMLERGQYDKKGEKVEAGVPAALSPLKAGAPRNRLGLAQWLVDPSHPLTSRVLVNRYWQMYFGVGLVETAEDFGSQGEQPSHPDLLDWLAIEMIESGWDVKRMQRLIVTSATYRQSSKATPALVERDPANRVLAHGPRFRLQAEFLRDQALAVSGLLNAELGGASVYPYQPAGLWEEMAFGGGFTAQSYTPSTGEDLYRRTMYTFWKRTVPPPSLSTFDAPDREICTVRRPRTNTPLQALVLLNDPTYVESARHLAQRLMTEAAAEPAARLEMAYRLIMARKPRDEEVAVLRKLFDEQLAVYRQDVEAAKQLLSVGASPRNEQLDPAEHAAWTMIASTLLNLDEAVNKN